MKFIKGLVAGASLVLSGLTHSVMADPADDFGWILIAQVNDGDKVAEVDALVSEILDAARGNTGTLVFNFARVGDTLYGYEMFDDQAAFFGHFSRVEALVPRMMELWTPSAIVPTHDLPDDIAQIMGQMGAAQPDFAAALVH